MQYGLMGTLYLGMWFPVFVTALICPPTGPVPLAEFRVYSSLQQQTG